jgi:hypothetical protein
MPETALGPRALNLSLYKGVLALCTEVLKLNTYPNGFSSNVLHVLYHVIEVMVKGWCACITATRSY